MSACSRLHHPMLQSAEKIFFRTLNRVAEPALRHGCGSPWLLPVGAVVLETIGRKSGRVYNIPVLASEWRSMLVVSTVRGSSQWIKNIAAEPQIHVWLRGKRRAFRAYVVSNGELQAADDPNLPRGVARLIALLGQMSEFSGASFAVLLQAETPVEIATASANETDATIEPGVL